MPLRNRMHPRNIYKTPPNFKELAIQYPEFRKYVKQELSGRITLDFNNRKAVLELSRLLLLKDFNLRVEINEARLIPRVPISLNYILWIEDLLGVLETNEVRGIDIGTGSACIYSLLASTKGWNMLATEIDRVSFDSAVENVKRNNLTDKITVKYVDNSNKLLEGVIDSSLTYHFCMCNPPFFDTDEKPVNRTRKRKMIEVAASYVDTEVVTSGGEVEFLKKLIAESQILRDKVKIYSTLVGKKIDFRFLKKELSQISDIVMTETEFCQGNTVRWGLAWSFLDVDFSGFSKTIQKSKKEKMKVLEYIIPKDKCKMEEALVIVLKILEELKIRFSKECSSDGYIFTVKAFKNTWSHQRQKNRLKMREQKEFTSDGEKDIDCDTTQPTCSKKMNLDDDKQDGKDGSDANQLLVECLLLLREKDENLALETSWLSGDKESVHQIFQYIKNNWTKIELD